jgi:hypothetical protein
VTTITYIPDDDPLAAAVAEFLAAKDSGQPLSAEQWLARYPDLANDLRGFLQDDELDAGLRAFRGELKEPDLRTDERFVGDYELLERVGGNMGVVYRARQLSLGREVAVKVLLRAGTADRARFRREAEATARLRHPNIVRIFEVSRGDALPFFSMEWYPNGTLASRVAEFVRQPNWAAGVVTAIAHAVHHAHRRGLLHRDLKPANVLVDENDQPIVADFGLVVNLDGTSMAERRGAGTPAYMAPEQLTGEITVETDVFGLGAVLYELLTGQPPAIGATLPEILDHVRTAEPVAPRRLNPHVDPDLDAICMKCLAKDPGARYATAADVADDLERFRLGLSIRARPRGPLDRVGRLLREARGATDFRSMAPGLFAQAAFVLASNATVFALLRSGANELWVWAALMASYVPLFVLLARDRWTDRRQYNPARLHLWAIWTGHATACVGVLVSSRLTAGADFARGIETGYVGCAGVNTLAFVVMGSLFAGRQYLLGLAWSAAAVVMGVFLPLAPLVYGVLMAVCSLVTGLQLQALEPEPVK